MSNDEHVVGNLDDYKNLAKQHNQVCPQCGYCPCCGRPRGNINYPSYPWPYYPTVPYYQGPTCTNT